MVILRFQTPHLLLTGHYISSTHSLPFRLFYLYFPIFTERLQRLLRDNNHYIYDNLRRLLQPLLSAKTLLNLRPCFYMPTLHSYITLTTTFTTVTIC
jgi:hypothetical protein